MNPRLTNFVTLVNLRLIILVKKVKRGEVLRGGKVKILIDPCIKAESFHSPSDGDVKWQSREQDGLVKDTRLPRYVLSTV